MVMKIYRADGREFIANPKDVANEGVPFLAFNQSNFDSTPLVVFSDKRGWKVERGAFDLYRLIDNRGEYRHIKPYQFHEAVLYENWTAYDAAIQQRTQEILQDRFEIASKRVFILEDALINIKRINERGGPGSRKTVREIIDKLV